MTVLILIGAGAGVIAAAILLPFVAYAVFGDEMPSALEDWGPFLSMVGSLLGAVLIFAAIAIGAWA